VRTAIQPAFTPTSPTPIEASPRTFAPDGHAGGGRRSQPGAVGVRLPAAMATPDTDGNGHIHGHADRPHRDSPADLDAGADRYAGANGYPDTRADRGHDYDDRLQL